MGMYDTVLFECPKCTNTVEVQSKAGACGLKYYNSDTVPPAIAADIDGDRVYCHDCDASWLVAAKTYTKHIPMMLTQLPPDEGEE